MSYKKIIFEKIRYWYEDSYFTDETFLKIINNINFIAGLINSDGYVYMAHKKYLSYRIVNTVESIINACCDSLTNNKINFKVYNVDGVYDSRTSKINKPHQIIAVAQRDSIKKLNSIIKFKIKGNK